MTRERVGIERTILCATRFWSWYQAPTKTRGPTVPTLLRGVRGVVAKQGFTGPQISKALAKLEREGFVRTGGQRMGKTIALTEKGGRVGCATVKLSPWTNPEYPGSALKGASCGCSRKG